MTGRRVIGVIPARMAASRFPGKPLARILDRPMIEHVYRGTAACPLLDDVFVATCDDVIADAVRAFGGRAIMTSSHHVRASDRVAEACAHESASVVAMVQGDEPMVRPEMVTAAVTALFDDASVGCVNLMAPVDNVDEAEDRDTIKVVTDHAGRALYMSRSPIPSQRSPATAPLCFKQVCVIAFRRETLLAFASLPPGRLEQIEAIDMLRLLEHGIAVRMVRTDVVTHAVDSPEDIGVVEALWADGLRSRGEARL